MKFAKLFESEKYGQILIQNRTNSDDKPEVKFSVVPPGLGICSAGLEFEKYESSDAYFNSIDIVKAEEIANGIFKTTANV